jgi:hypothetical protein
MVSGFLRRGTELGQYNEITVTTRRQHGHRVAACAHASALFDTVLRAGLILGRSVRPLCHQVLAQLVDQ